MPTTKCYLIKPSLIPVLLLVIFPVYGWGGDQPAQRPVQVDISVVSCRPVSDALEIMSRHNLAILYEDMPVEHDRDIDDISYLHRQIPSDRPRLRTKIKRFDFRYIAEDGGKTLHDPSAVLGDLVEAYARQQLPGRFETRQIGDIFVVRPKQYLNRAGDLVDYASPLDRRVSFSVKDKPLEDIFDLLLDQVNQGNDDPVRSGMAPTNYFVNTVRTIEVDHQPAAEVLANLLRSDEYSFSWWLFRSARSLGGTLNVMIGHPPLEARAGNLPEAQSEFEFYLEGPTAERDFLRIVGERYGWVFALEDPRSSSTKTGIRLRGTIYELENGQPLGDPIEILTAILNREYNTQGQWQIQREDRLFTVLPISHWSRDPLTKEWKTLAQDAMLNVLLDYSVAEGSVREQLDRLCQQLSQKSALKVSVGAIPANMAMPERRIQSSFTKQTLNQVLMQMLNTQNKRFSWHLYYDPVKEAYTLNIYQEPLR